MNKYFKQYNRFKLNELNIHVSEDESGDDLEGKYFISHRGDVWIFNEDEWENEFWNLPIFQRQLRSLNII